MKIIISHDVDHLYPIDHLLHDLIIPKLWIRSTIHLLQGKISITTFIYRLGIPFYKNYHCIEKVVQKDKEYNIPSTFFLGMERGLGMSYGGKKAKPYINYLEKEGFDVGVHGVAYEDKNKMEKEYHDFLGNTICKEIGVRMHYVRMSKKTLPYLCQIGYLYDTSEFDKSGKSFKSPFNVNGMWEFPLHIMDGYILPVGELEKGKINTINAIKKAESANLPYCTILYHDYLYNNHCYPTEKKWYDWLLNYLKDNDYNYISYKDAIKEMENCIYGQY